MISNTQAFIFFFLLIALIFWFVSQSDTENDPSNCSIHMNRFYGQTGNQLFQYAAIRSYSLRNQTSYRVPENIYLCWRNWFPNLPSIDAWGDSTSKQSAKICNYEPPSNFRFDPNFCTRQKNCTVLNVNESYFQSFKYFSDFENEIREELQFSNELICRNQVFFTSENKVRVGIQVRRKDYLNNNEMSDYFIMTSPYLKKHMEYFRRREKSVQFIFVSDDLEWCRQHFSQSSDCSFSSRSQSAIEDLCLLSLCDHFIISASTFSWWGAFLSTRKSANEKIVITPPNWFHPQGRFSKFSDEDIILETWFRSLKEELPKFRVPHAFPAVSKNRFYTFDIFIQHDEVYLISNYYKNNWEERVDFFTEMKLVVNGLQLNTAVQEIGDEGYESTRCIIYKIPLEWHHLPYHTVQIQHNFTKLTKSFMIAPENNMKHSKLTAATLFKDDFEWIELWYRYYKEQGVDRFILYYNGNIQDIWSKIPHQYPEIEYGSWPYAYWDLNQHCNHHAQTTFLTMIRNRYQKSSDFLILNDLDEFIANTRTSETLLQYFHRTQQVLYIVPNCWAKFKKVSNQQASSFFSENTLAIIPDAQQLGFGWALRNKCIYSPGYQGLIGVHLPKIQNPEKLYACHDLVMYHVVDCGHNDRLHWLENPQNDKCLLLNLAPRTEQQNKS